MRPPSDPSLPTGNPRDRGPRSPRFCCVPCPRPEPRVAGVQSLLRPIGDRDHPGELANAPGAKPVAHPRSVPIVPGRFDEQPAQPDVARLRDGAALLLASARGLTRHQAQIRHERTRRIEAAPVVSSATQASAVSVSIPRKQRSQPTGSRCGTARLGDGFEVRVQGRESPLDLLEPEQVIVEDRLGG